MGYKPGTAAQAVGRAGGYSSTEAVWRQHGGGVIFTSLRSILELKFFVLLGE